MSTVDDAKRRYFILSTYFELHHLVPTHNLLLNTLKFVNVAYKLFIFYFVVSALKAIYIKHMQFVPRYFNFTTDFFVYPNLLSIINSNIIIFSRCVIKYMID